MCWPPCKKSHVSRCSRTRDTIVPTIWFRPPQEIMLQNSTRLFRLSLFISFFGKVLSVSRDGKPGLQIYPHLALFRGEGGRWGVVGEFLRSPKGFGFMDLANNGALAIWFGRSARVLRWVCKKCASQIFTSHSLFRKQGRIHGTRCA